MYPLQINILFLHSNLALHFGAGIVYNVHILYTTLGMSPLNLGWNFSNLYLNRKKIQTRLGSFFKNKIKVLRRKKNIFLDKYLKDFCSFINQLIEENTPDTLFDYFSRKSTRYSEKFFIANISHYP